jgi:hypothetical protein
VRKQSAVTTVVGTSRTDDAVDAVQGSREVHTVFGELFVMSAMAEDVLPRL